MTEFEDFVKFLANWALHSLKITKISQILFKTKSGRFSNIQNQSFRPLKFLEPYKLSFDSNLMILKAVTVWDCFSSNLEPFKRVLSKPLNFLQKSGKFITIVTISNKISLEITSEPTQFLSKHLKLHCFNCHTVHSCGC